ncbi:SGNH/GDSL hydrolase family protein [Atopobium fossor]|uniref:SGNH/GDSL hydrolase family protein n=1 Tax=Atopobium fossor TaxID=39487 RepID=UPI0004002822|nr:SGNH/GDSL hydrolase family protein [Atopobium fossor]
MDSSWIFAFARDFLHGCLAFEERADGWVCPQRFTDNQRVVLGSCLAWHPGLYKQMATCTSGATLEFVTDATLVDIELSFGEEPVGTGNSRKLTEQFACQEGKERQSTQVFDGVSHEVNGKHKGMLFVAMQDGQTAQVHIALPESKTTAPTLFDIHKLTRVRVFLPALRSCAVRTIACNGSVLKPLEKKDQLLVLGDSLTQGFVSGDPAKTWAHQLAHHKKLDVLNQGIGGQVFLPETLQDFSALPEFTPQSIVVAFGINYRYEPCTAHRVSKDIHRYFSVLHALWPAISTYVLTPLWHQVGPYPTHKHSCFDQIPQLIEHAVATHSNMTLIDGTTLLDANISLLSDGFEHPNTAGHTQIAERLFESMRTQNPSYKVRISASEKTQKPVVLPAQIEQMNFDF